MRKWRVPFIVTPEEAKNSRRYFKIPVSILEIVREQNLFAPFRLFMYFKTVSTSGQMRITRHTIALAATDLGISEKTVNRHFQILKNRNWIGRLNSGSCIIRSFDKLRVMEKTDGRTAVWFDVERHLKSFREFVVSACIGRLISKQKAKLWRKKQLPGSRRGIPNERKSSLPTSFPVASEAMKKLFGISIGTAFNWKRDAHEAGFITVTKVLAPVTIDNVPEWKRVYPELAKRLIVRDDRYFIQHPDKVQCNLHFSRRRCLSSLDKK